MPRLIVIDGPKAGESYSLEPENYLGVNGVELEFSYSGDINKPLAMVVRGRDGFELVSLAESEEVLVNGEAVMRARVNHGDMIAIADAVLIFDTDESEDSHSMPPVGATSTNLQKIDTPPSGAWTSVSLTSLEQVEHTPSDLILQTGDFNRGTESHIEYRIKPTEDASGVPQLLSNAERDLATLLKIANTVANALDLPALLRRILDIIFEVLPVDRGAILLFEKKRRKLKTMASKSRVGEDRVLVSKTIAKEVLRKREAILSLDAMSDTRFSTHSSVHEQNIRAAMCAPLLRKDKIMGLIHVDSYTQPKAFSRSDLALLTGIAQQASIAIENSRLYREVGERERYKYEISLATTIQRELLPRRLPSSKKISVYGKMVPAKEVGGDYFDFIDHETGRSVYICVGDVSGKGVPAGLIMVMARSYLRPLTLLSTSPRRVLSQTNRFIHADTRREMFMSAILLHWDDETEKMVYSGAGHEYFIHYKSHQRKAEVIRAGGIALGLLKESENFFQDTTLDWNPGDALVLYTDGLIEACTSVGEPFGIDRLLKTVVEHGEKQAKELLEGIVGTVRSFIGNRPQKDDMSVVTVKLHDSLRLSGS